MTTTDIIKDKTAVGMARSITQILRKQGIPIVNRSNPNRWTEGMNVHRIGVSTTVSISYHIPIARARTDLVARKRGEEYLEQTREILQQRQLPYQDSQTYLQLECEFA